MKQKRANTHVTRPLTGGGFTLIELVAVIVITTIMAAVAIPTMSSLASSRAGAAQKLIQRDLSYARERAICTGCRSWVVFDIGSDSYSILAEPAGTPGRVGAAVIDDPATGRTFNQRLGSDQFAGVSLVSASFDSAAEVGFDWRGKPITTSGAALAAVGTVTISGSKAVTVQPGSGLIQAP